MDIFLFAIFWIVLEHFVDCNLHYLTLMHHLYKDISFYFFICRGSKDTLDIYTLDMHVYKMCRPS